MCSESYKYYKEHHICVSCGQENAEKNHTQCLNCMMKARERALIYFKKHKKELQEKSRIRAKNRYENLKEQGICTSCGKRPAADNKILCKHCAARINYRNRQKYLLNIYASKNIYEISI